MEKMKHRFWVAIMVLGIMVFLVSCTGNDNSAGNESNSVQSQSQREKNDDSSDVTEQDAEAENAEKESQYTEGAGVEAEDSSPETSSSEDEFTPLEVEENTQVELGEDETYAIH